VRKLLWIVALGAMAAFPATARADGIAFAGVQHGGKGVASTDALVHYVTLPVRKQTVITKVGAEGGVLAFRALPGAWGIPMVAFDGSTAGLSADGRILVLAQPPIGRMRQVSRFPVLRATNLRPIEVVTLEGSFSFDALSPDGSTLYLIEHVNRNDVAEYQVRAYDLAQKRLLPYAIRDHQSNQVEMYGYPMSRVTGVDGRWAYTLYQGRHHSFVHALDTVARKAVCIDLPMDTPPEHVGDARLVLGPGGETLTVDSRAGGTVAVIETGNLTLRPVETDVSLRSAQRDVSPRRAQAGVPAAAPADEEFPWLLLASAFAVALLLAGLRVRRRRPVPTSGSDGARDQDDRRESGVASGMSGSFSLDDAPVRSSPPTNETPAGVAVRGPVRRHGARVPRRARPDRRAADALRSTR
jgi:hypothetical protein